MVQEKLFNISGQKWNLLLNARDEALPYQMTYYAVSMYANEDPKLGMVFDILKQQLYKVPRQGAIII